MDEIPHCNDANKLLDLWSHPLLNPKLKDIVTNIHIATPALPITASGKHSPYATYKNLAIFTLQLVS